MKYRATGLKPALKERGSSVTWLAERTGISRPILSNIVNGTRPANEPRARRIAMVMALPLGQLFREDIR